jgi:hypothetical protein
MLSRRAWAEDSPFHKICMRDSVTRAGSEWMIDGELRAGAMKNQARKMVGGGLLDIRHAVFAKERGGDHFSPHSALSESALPF